MADASRNELSGSVSGPVIQARDISGGVHVHASPVSVLQRPPRQLPPVSTLFTGRAQDLARLDESWHEAQAQDSGLLLVISGTAGVGKSALALQWLRSHTDTFPDGQLYFDLAGYARLEPVSPRDVAAGFLRALGVDSDQIPETLAERTALLRTLVYGRRLAVLLENPVSAAQVRALALVTPGCATVVTTRDALSGLAMDGARTHKLEPWRAETAVRLMTRMLGENRVNAEPEQALAVARLCGGLPLAVGVATARLVARPRWPLARLAHALAVDGQRLEVLSPDEERAVRPALDGSYRILPQPDMLLYRRLGLCPLPWFDPDAAAAAVGADTRDDAEDDLETLVDASLLEYLADGRYRFHDLVRLHAAHRAQQDETERDRAAVLSRVFDFYLHTTTRVAAAITPVHQLLERDYQFSTPIVVEFPHETAGLDWLDAQRPNLMALLRYGAAHNWHRLTWRLAYAMWPLFLRRRYPEERLESQRLALEAARAEGHRVAEGRLLTSLAGTLAAAGRLSESVDYNRQALDLYERTGDRRGLAQASNGLAKDYLTLGDLDQAESLFELALRVRTEIGHERGIYLSHQGLGRVAAACDDSARAAWHHRHAYRGLSRLGDQYDAAWCLALWARVIADRGQPHRALRLLTHAVEDMRAAGSPYGQAGIRELTGEVHERLGELPSARACYVDAAALFAGIDPGAEARLRDRLDALGEHPPTPTCPGAPTIDSEQ